MRISGRHIGTRNRALVRTRLGKAANSNSIQMACDRTKRLRSEMIVTMKYWLGLKVLLFMEAQITQGIQAILIIMYIIMT